MSLMWYTNHCIIKVYPPLFAGKRPCKKYKYGYPSRSSIINLMYCVKIESLSEMGIKLYTELYFINPMI